MAATTATTATTTATGIPDYEEIYNQIYGNTYTPKYQNANGLSNLTSEYMKTMEPTWQAQKTNINQQFNDASNKGLEFMSNKGLSRSGANFNSMQTNEQNRANALGNAYGNLTQSATTNALNAANLGLTEQNMVQNQKNAAVSQLTNLLSQYQNKQQQDLANAYTLAGLTGTYNGQDTLAKQTLDAQTQQYINGLAAQIMSSYAEGTDTFTLPQSVITLLNSLFTPKTTTA